MTERTETQNVEQTKESGSLQSAVDALVMPVCTLCGEDAGKFMLGENTPAEIGPICFTCRNTILSCNAKTRTLKVVWNDGKHNWHHDFEITSPPVLSDVLVVHVSGASMDDLRQGFGYGGITEQ